MKKILFIIMFTVLLVGCSNSSAQNDTDVSLQDVSQQSAYLMQSSETAISVSQTTIDDFKSSMMSDDLFIHLLRTALEAKTDNTLYQEIEHLENEDKLTITIVREPINQANYESELLKLGFDESVYGNESMFQSEIVSELPEEDRDAQIIELRRAYKMARLQAIKNVTQASQHDFLSNYDIDMDDVVYRSDYTTTLTVTITKDTLLELITDRSVISASLYEAMEIDINS